MLRTTSTGRAEENDSEMNQPFGNEFSEGGKARELAYMTSRIRDDLSVLTDRKVLVQSLDPSPDDESLVLHWNVRSLFSYFLSLGFSERDAVRILFSI